MARSAEEANEEGIGLLDAGRLEEARPCFEEATRLAPDWAVPHYNLGLIYKLEKNWPESLRWNKAAFALDPQDVATCWNMTIAACALSDWRVAEQGFRAIGLTVPEGEPPWDFQLGITPIRLNPEGSGEVVWARRLDTSRACILSIPLPESGFSYRDIVLHDAEPVGYRQYKGREFPVFNCLQLWQSSGFVTHDVQVECRDQNQLDAALAVMSEHGAEVEDWTSSLRSLCRACSEGRPHDHHDNDLAAVEESWRKDRRLGVALPAGLDLAAVMSVCRLEWRSDS